MEVVIKRGQTDYRVVRTGLNWLVYCQHEGDDSWIGAINDSHLNRAFKAVRVAVTNLPPAEPLEQELFNSVDDAVQWVITLTENALRPVPVFDKN